jgi:sugar lactone lactonase YvrE
VKRAARRIILSVALAILAVVAYLAFWPVPIEPAAWDPPEAPALEGPYALNDALAQGTRLLEGIGAGPEDVAFDRLRRLYTGFEDGRIVRMMPPYGAPEVFADTGGRPLGMVFDAEGHLIVADARKGLLSISPEGQITVLAAGLGDEPFGFLDDLDIGPDGTIYFTDAARFGYGAHQLAILEHGGDGRLFSYDPTDGTVSLLLDGLQFANGVVVEPSGESLFVAETGAYRIQRFWLKGNRLGETEVFVANLPGFPDNIARTPRGGLWVPMSSPRHPLADRLAPRPFLRKVVARLPAWTHPDALRHGLVVELDPDGRPIRALHDPSGGVALTSCAMERDGILYVGSFQDPSLVAVPLS